MKENPYDAAIFAHMKAMEKHIDIMWAMHEELIVDTKHRDIELHLSNGLTVKITETSKEVKVL